MMNCCVIGKRGMARRWWNCGFEEVLQDPGKMPIEYSFESLLYLASDAYEQKTGEAMTYLPKYNFETYQNRSGWKKA